jgi:hypothetical protein
MVQDVEGVLPAAPATPGIDLTILRSMFRNYQGFKSLYESDGIDTLRLDGGAEFSLWDLTYLIEEGLPLLPSRQSEAIYWCLICNKRETDAASLMGVSPTNPVSMYANSGLRKLMLLIEQGALPKFRCF